ncbi:MAG: hypothetical protein CME62_05105 [Halobacteriovoraceae bacterium]|nr:hypothetical protein [Halobacteriovoraceae bacterium]|tara:strand:+ start:17429 stop:18343 length:915 start_codon:yes stop_codon:yes gene_type:complete
MKWVVLFVFCFSPLTWGKEYKKNIVDRAHRNFSNRILRFSNEVDAFFADDQHDDLVNKSRLQVSLNTRFREAAGPVVIPDIDFRLVLPRTEKRFRLFIENENEDTDSETSETRIDRQNNNARSESSAAGIRYMINQTGIKFYTDTGIIVNVPPEAFARFTASRDITFKYWILKFKEQVRYVVDDGIRSTTDLNFDKRLTHKLMLRMMNQAVWTDEDYIITFENGPSLFQTISDRIGLSYHAHVISVNSPNFIVTNYILQATYRQELYGRWLFMNLTPFTNFPRENNFGRVPGFLVRFDAIFGHI